MVSGKSLVARLDGSVGQRPHHCSLCAFAFAPVAFTGVQAWFGEKTSSALPPLRSQIFCLPTRRRWLALGRSLPESNSRGSSGQSSLLPFRLASGFFVLIYFLPVHLPATKGMAAFGSGIASIPLILSDVVGLIMVGGLDTQFGHCRRDVVPHSARRRLYGLERCQDGARGPHGPSIRSCRR